MEEDKIFDNEIKKPSDFRFNAQVAGVFDDMVNRSVPFYGEVQRMIAELSADYASPGTNVYDLGCATGTTLIGMNTGIRDDIHFIGIDDSQQMLDKCCVKLQQNGFKRSFELIKADLHNGVTIHNASVVVSCLTLQFVRPMCRQKLVQSVYDGLISGGAFILFEKILAEEVELNRAFIKYYYDMKRRNDYSEMEIAQKREALENVLIPYKLSENVLLLRECGFAHTEIFFKWYNFAGIIAIKN